MQPSGVLDRMIEDGRLGRKNGLGFHRYENGKDRGADPTVAKLFGSGGAPTDEIGRRCLYVMVNEAAYALEEQVVDGPDPVDLAMVMGTGFPPFRGGLLRWADVEGIQTIHDALSDWADTLGNRFAPAPLLALMAEQNRTFTDIT
jgi:3-hydroxyacyl-CoA dehydrogenase/enoyl-CoA hydratase/3-hydroxybutyryl-CoA epimerase